jgi:hypothetical protein
VTVNSNSDDDAEEDDAGDGNDLAPPSPASLALDRPMVFHSFCWAALRYVHGVAATRPRGERRRVVERWGRSA